MDNAQILSFAAVIIMGRASHRVAVCVLQAIVAQIVAFLSAHSRVRTTEIVLVLIYVLAKKDGQVMIARLHCARKNVLMEVCVLLQMYALANSGGTYGATLERVVVVQRIVKIMATLNILVGQGTTVLRQFVYKLRNLF